MSKKKINIIDKVINTVCDNRFLKPLHKLYYRKREVWLYLLFGALTTLINIVIYQLLSQHIYYMVSNIIAWVIAVLFAFVTNKTIVFESNDRSKDKYIKEIGSFFFVRIVSLFIDSMIMFVGISLLMLDDIIIKIIANIFVIIINYLMSKYIVFKK